MFLAALPAWGQSVTHLLDVCRDIGRNVDWEHGLMLDDPLDGAKILWNPIQRAMDNVPTGKHLVRVRRPGVSRKVRRSDGREVRKFLWRDPHVDSRKLANRVAPCLMHTLDAYFNALVLQRLYKAGLTNVVAIHDSWFVPLVVSYPDGRPWAAGEKVLQDAIVDAGREWLEGIGSVYRWLADETLGTPHRAFARDIRKRWRERVAIGDSPRFAAS